MRVKHYQAFCCLILATSPCVAQQDCAVGPRNALDSKRSEKNLLQVIFRSESPQNCSDSSGYSNLDQHYITSPISDETFRSQLQNQPSARSKDELTSISEFSGVGAKSTRSSVANQRSNRVVNGYSIVKGE